MKNWLPRKIAALRATIHTKLLTAFLAIALLLLSAAGVALQSLNAMNQRAEQTAQLHRKIAAYRQLNHASVAQLYGVASALVEPEARRLDATLRQLKQFGYDLDRLQFLSRDELAAMENIRAGFEEFIVIVTRAIELIREGKTAEGRHLQMSVASALAERLERYTNQLVNKAEADIIADTELANEAYANSRRVLIACAAVSVALALGMGYVISRSLIDAIARMEAGMRDISKGDFFRRVDIPNRDELGALAQDMNRMSEELGRLYAQLDAARENAERANRDKSRFLAAASHDLRQPMHAITLWIANLQVALGGKDGRETRRAIEAVEAACKSMSASFNAILDLSRLDARAGRPALEKVDALALAGRVAEEFGPQVRQKGLEIRLRGCSRGMAVGLSDEVMLGRVLRNLVSNATKFTRAGGVLIGVAPRRNKLRITVYDTGPGIPQRHRDDIFKEYYQIANGREPQQGAGLGLAIVRKSIELLDGHELDFSSREGRGSRFSILLPRAASGAGAPPEGSVVRSHERIRGSYIAVVDDEPLVLRGLVALLEHWGCLVEAGRSGAELATAMALNERIPDLLIADWSLANGETGLDVAGRINKEAGREVPVLLMTGEPLAEVRGGGARTKLVHKPIDAVQLQALLDDLLPERQFI
ncbi:MAG: ATP-binding protein [Burkholderiales bacterium]